MSAAVSELILPASPAPASASPALRIAETDAQAQRKALLLEDDPSFREIMQDFLKDQGLDVVPVQNGVEGVHEVLASDFDAILCDMNMPTLPGDMFFRAVERMRPHLCDRFIFMTGYRGNAKVNDFMRSVNGISLIKPFPMDELQELLAFVELRSILQAA
jgi:DNA-binding NtrC family response regulator